MAVLSPKAIRERYFKTTGYLKQSPPGEGQKPKASGWVFATKNPPRRCGEGFSSLHPLPRRDSQVAIKLICKIQVLNDRRSAKTCPGDCAARQLAELTTLQPKCPNY
jgi:hypothetical protein